MSWSDRFAAYLARRGLSQQDAVFALRAFGIRVTQSQVHYWCRGSVPRLATRERIAVWSDGEVAADAGVDESTDDIADGSGEHSAVIPGATGS